MFDYYRCILVIFFILLIYIGSPKINNHIPSFIKRMFQQTWFRGVIIFTVVFNIKSDINTSLVVTTLFMVFLVLIQNEIVYENFLDNYNTAQNKYI